MNDTEQLVKNYYEWLNKQAFVEKDLDYSALEKYKPMLKNLSLLGNIGVYAFDLFRKENVFTFYNFTAMYGYDQVESEKKSSEFLNSKIHPEDFPKLIENATEFLKFLFPLSKEERGLYKLVSEYRVLSNDNKYVRLLEQYQVLEFDKHGNIWLTLGTMDISPDQIESEGLKSQLLEYKSGRFLPLPENEIGTSTKDKFFDEEKKSVLSENVHKVNVQRKKIIEKLHAENAAEVSKRILKFGLLE